MGGKESIANLEIGKPNPNTIGTNKAKNVSLKDIEN
jgi:hypothetical protein